MIENSRYPILVHCLKYCKLVSPQSFADIIDVGVRFGTDFLANVFPESRHFLFEPVLSCEEKIRQFYESRGINHDLRMLALGSEKGNLFLHQFSSDRSGKITHSEISNSKESTSSNLHSVVPVHVETLDSSFPDGVLTDLGYLLKLDVDGIEEQIIKGGSRIVSGASFVVIEASVVRRNVIPRLALLEGLGFRLFDICDNAYYYNQLSCFDLVFINERLRASEVKFRPWEFSKWKVNWRYWQQGYPKLEEAALPVISWDK